MYKITNKETNNTIILNSIDTALFFKRNNKSKYKVKHMPTIHDKVFNITMYVLVFSTMAALLYIGCYIGNLVNELTLIK